MDNDELIKHINILIEKINRTPAISAQGLKNTPFPDEAIASLHNHLGNTKHYISDELTAFNATEQFLSLKTAIKEIQAANDDLFLLHSRNVINDVMYQLLNQDMHELDERIRRSIDPEYT